MGTKTNPGKFDCYANATPDEPMFVLLGRDKHAPTLVRLWAALREIDNEDAEKTREALDCANSMDNYRANKRGSTNLASPRILEAIAQILDEELKR